MNISVLNECHLNEEHLERLRKLGSLTVNDGSRQRIIRLLGR